MKTIVREERLTSRERVILTFNNQPADRVPVNYMYNPGIDRKLKQYFGLAKNDDEGLRQALGVDFRSVDAKYIGPKLHKDMLDRKIDPIFGFRTKYMENESGGYWMHCDFPLAEGDVETAESWPFPNPDYFDYDSLEAQCERHKDYGIVLGSSGLGVIICRLGFYMGLEQALVSLYTEDPAGLTLIDRLLDFQYRHLERMLDKVGKQVQLIWMGEDLGTQVGPMISMDLFETQILSRHKRFLDLANAYNIPVMLHTCGCSSWTYEKYIASGLRAVDTLQPEAVGMSPRYLKETFGNRLTFHGCISTQGVLTSGTPKQVEQCVKETLEVMMPGGGYCLAPTHRLQDNMPVENAISMYKAAHNYGRY